MTSQKGFLTLSLIFLTPLLLTLLFAFSHILSQALAIAKTHQSCRTQVTQYQKTQRQLLIKLLLLNSKATQLRIQRKKAETQLALALTTGRGPLIAFRQAQLNRITKKQHHFQRRQQRLFLKSQQAKTQLQRELFSQDLLTSSIQIKKIDFKKSLSVTKHPPTSLTPSYFPSTHFNQRQSVIVHWSMNFKRHNLLHRPSARTYNSQCGATLNKKGGRWLLAMTRGS